MWWERALEMLQGMAPRVLEPNIICYSATMNACVKNVRWEKALELIWGVSQVLVWPDIVGCGTGLWACEKGE